MNINNFCFHILLAQYLSDKVMKFKEILRSGYYAVIIFLNVCIHLHPRQQLKVNWFPWFRNFYKHTSYLWFCLTLWVPDHIHHCAHPSASPYQDIWGNISYKSYQTKEVPFLEDQSDFRNNTRVFPLFEVTLKRGIPLWYHPKNSTRCRPNIRSLGTEGHWNLPTEYSVTGQPKG